MKLTNILFIPIALFFTFAAVSCDNDTSEDNQQWVLVWQDEFDTPTLDNRPDPTKWGYDIGATGWGNQELQYYTDRVENASLTTHEGTSCLKITAIQENYGGAGFTSARINTKGLFDQTYGRFEARMKLPWGPGIWPAFWMLGADIDANDWPVCGEIDIMEFKGYQTNIIHGSLHGPGYSGGSAITKSFGYADKRFDTDFNVFAVEWTEDRIDFIVNGRVFNRVTRKEIEAKGEWVFNKPFFLILNLAVGGTFVGDVSPDTQFPQDLYIDYVRVYRRN